MLDRKEQILAVAGELLQTRSFRALSYQDLSDRIGISKASIHHHYPSKEDLGRALVERFRSHFTGSLEGITQKYNRPWDRFEAYIAMISEIMQSGTKICPIGALQAEHNVISVEMQQELGKLSRNIHSWIAEVLIDGKRQGTMNFAGTPEDQAALIFAALQGALQNARAEGPKQFTAVVRQLKAGMKRRA